MTDEEIEKGIETACNCNSVPSTGWTVNPFPIIRDYINRLKAEKEPIRKETAKEILKVLNRTPHEYHEKKIKELSQFYGVEVDE